MIVRIGHINLAPSFSSAGDNFIALIEALRRHGIHQHLVVRDASLAKRLSIIENVAVGSTVRSSIIAYCMMPDVDVVHIHDSASANAGLLLTLTRSIPFVLNYDECQSQSHSPVLQATISRSSGVVAPGTCDAVEHMKLYRRAADSLRVPTMLL